MSTTDYPIRLALTETVVAVEMMAVATILSIVVRHLVDLSGYGWVLSAGWCATSTSEQ